MTTRNELHEIAAQKDIAQRAATGVTTRNHLVRGPKRIDRRAEPCAMNTDEYSRQKHDGKTTEKAVVAMIENAKRLFFSQNMP